MAETVDRVSHEIRQFHGDNVWRDEGGVVWVRQRDAIDMMGDAWQRGITDAGLNSYMARNGMIPNPYRPAPERESVHTRVSVSASDTKDPNPTSPDTCDECGVLLIEAHKPFCTSRPANAAPEMGPLPGLTPEEAAAYNEAMGFVPEPPGSETE